jgi:hypothetical protein
MRSRAIFWIDALCIDQCSILERNHQVAQMCSIYTKAQEVIAWLGNTPFDPRLLDVNLDMAGPKPQIEDLSFEIGWIMLERNIQFGIYGWAELMTNEY